MATDKIVITDKLRYDIIERRKEKGISCYELSERTGNGHSKFWLQNIENGKTKKISQKDLISLYMAMDEDIDEEDAINEIECVLNQSIGASDKQWYELINISENYADIYDDEELMDELKKLLEDKIIDNISNAIFNMSTHQKQAALTALQNFYYSLYKNPDLAFALINIPIYGVNDMDKEEHNIALNDIMAINAKYYDLVLKNNSLETIKRKKELNDYFDKISRQTIQTAFINFEKMLSQIIEASKTENPNLKELVNKFVTDVTFLIERGQPNAIKCHLQFFLIRDGKGFAEHIEDCYNWFARFKSTYGIKDIYQIIPEKLLKSVCEYLNGVGEI